VATPSQTDQSFLFPPSPDGSDTGEKREHTIPLEEAEEDELRDMIGPGT
jgi:hypothetical protein